MKPQTQDLSNYLGNNFCGDDSLQNMGTDYVLSWKSKRVYTSKLKPL